MNLRLERKIIGKQADGDSPLFDLRIIHDTRGDIVPTDEQRAAGLAFLARFDPPAPRKDHHAKEAPKPSEK
jgi:hypothetical protein